MSLLRVIRVCAAAAAIAAAVAFAPGAHVSRALAAGDCTVDPSMDSEERAFLALINNYRQQNGLRPLALSYGLTRASQWKSADMAKNGYFAHDDLTRTWDQRIRDCGYAYNTWLGENIAAGYTTAQSVFDAWRSSPGHNANMLGANYTAIGIGRYYMAGSPYGWYWTTDFGGVSDGYVSINEAPAPLVAPDAQAPAVGALDVAVTARPAACPEQASAHPRCSRRALSRRPHSAPLRLSQRRADVDLRRR